MDKNFKVKVNDSGRGTYLEGYRINEITGNSVVIARLKDNAGYFGDLKMYNIKYTATGSAYILFDRKRLHI